jgi:GNAT superfamily N-acetyltransferase
MTDLLDPQVLLAAYDSQLRGGADETQLPPGTQVEWDGPVRRLTGLYGGGFVDYRDLAGLRGEELDALIARQVAVFSARGEKFEWKTRSHDEPADLPQRLLAAGFEPEERETVVVGLASEQAVARPAPPGVEIRHTTSHEDFDRFAAMKSVVWETDMSWLADMLRTESGENMRVYVAEADGQQVSAAWIRFVPGTDFAGLWGGATLKEYRGRGIYKALVAVRAADAIERGYTYLQVDASDDSRPILERLGFVAVTSTTPYIWRPSTT